MTPKQKAELFNSYFCSVFPPLKALSITDDSPLLVSPADQLSDIAVSEEEAARHLAQLDPTKATGPDGIPARVLRECSYAIAPSLSHSLIIHYILVLFHLNGNQLMFHQFIRKIRTN
jgi:hypothetical protein